MNTAVTINLDYLLCSASECQSAWKSLHQAFQEAGFELQERMFTIGLPQTEATPLAEAAIRIATDRLALQGLVLGDVLRTCFAFEYQTLSTLDFPRPNSKGIEVSFMETGAFPALSGLYTH